MVVLQCNMLVMYYPCIFFFDPFNKNNIGATLVIILKPRWMKEDDVILRLLTSVAFQEICFSDCYVDSMPMLERSLMFSSLTALTHEVSRYPRHKSLAHNSIFTHLLLLQTYA